MVSIIAYRPTQSWIEVVSFILGLILIGYSILAFDSDTSFPGINALIPTTGAALIIYAGSAKVVGKLLTNFLAVRIGLISYSLYLAHWPIYVLYKYSRLGEISTLERFGLVVLSIIAGSLMYRYVESPLRHPKNTTVLSGSNFVLTSCLCALFASLPLAHSWANNGWEWRMEETIQRQLGQSFSEILVRKTNIRAPQCYMNAKGQNWDDFIANSRTCNAIKENSTIVLGDSHAADLWAALKTNYPDQNLIQITGAGCIAVAKKGRCGKLIEYAKNVIRDNPGKIKRILYTQRANKQTLKDGKPRRNQLINTREVLETLGTKVYWYGPQIEFKPDVPTLLAASLSMDSFYALAEKKQLSEIFLVDTAIQDIMEGSSVSYISKLKRLCPSGKCPITDNNRNLLYPDYGHWTKDGGAYLVKKLVPVFPQ